jgi:hypothetical protein
MSLETSAPNLKRFLEKYPKSRHFLARIENRYESLPEAQKKRVAGFLNTELGIALLRDTEIDEEAFSQVLSALSK